MKKTLAAFGMLVALVSGADDSFLYWMIGDTTGFTDYDTVKIKATDTSGSGSVSYLNLGWNSQGTFTSFSSSETTVLGAGNEYMQGMQANNVGFYASLGQLVGENFSYVIELYNGSQFMAQSESLSYSEASLNYIVNMNSDLKGMMAAWSPKAYAAPEPNSALLMAFGFAALVLRRRKQLAA